LAQKRNAPFKELKTPTGGGKAKNAQPKKQRDGSTVDSTAVLLAAVNKKRMSISCAMPRRGKVPTGRPTRVHGEVGKPIELRKKTSPVPR